MSVSPIPHFTGIEAFRVAYILRKNRTTKSLLSDVQGIKRHVTKGKWEEGDKRKTEQSTHMFLMQSVSVEVGQSP